MSIKLELQNMNQSKEDTISCENENGDSKLFEARLLIKPEVAQRTTSPMPLIEGDMYTAECNATGGTPMVNIKWKTSTDVVLTGNSTKDGQSQMSTLTYPVDKSLNGAIVSCLVEQYGTTIPYQLEPITVNFAPGNINYIPLTTLVEGDLISGTCIADGNPEPSVTYEITDSDGTFSEFQPGTRKVTVDTNGARVRCRATNSVNSTLSPESTLRVTKKPVRVPVTSPKPKVESTTQSAPVDSSVNAEKIVKPDDNSGDTDNIATADIQKSQGPRGIILSIVGVSCFLGFVIFLFFIRRCLKDRQGESYKTDELCTDEGASLHDPELEAHKKKEYFM